MAALKTYTLKQQGQGQTVTALKKFALVEVISMSDDDWIVVSELATVTAVTCYDLAEAATAYACTISEDNKVTIDNAEGATLDHLLFVCIGT